MGEKRMHSISKFWRLAIFFVSGNRLMVYTDVNLDFESERFYTVSIRTIDSGSPPLSCIVSIA